MISMLHKVIVERFFVKARDAQHEKKPAMSRYLPVGGG